MTRRSFNRKERAAIFERAGGACHICGGKIAVGDAWDVEHIRPLSMGGTNDPDNLAPAHAKCHRVKTAEEAGPRAKADRLRAKHTGTYPKSRTPLRSRGFASTRPNP
jgi:5-methylcytosine-specific restriction enzyme A